MRAKKWVGRSQGKERLAQEKSHIRARENDPAESD
jgi:hypothetical protein